MATELLIVGTSGLAKEAAQLARQIDPHASRWTQIAYVAAEAASLGQALVHGSVRYVDADLARLERSVDVVIGIGQPDARRRVALELVRHPQLSFPTLVHPSVETDEWVRIGRGCMVCKGVVLTCDIQVDEFVLLNWNVTVGHDSRIGAFTVVNPGSNVSGHVDVGEACLVGTGTQILEGLSVAAGTKLGAGCVVTTSIAAPGTWVGVPARKAR